MACVSKKLLQTLLPGYSHMGVWVWKRDWWSRSQGGTHASSHSWLHNTFCTCKIQPVFGNRMCPHCKDSIPVLQSYLQHLSSQHLTAFDLNTMRNQLENKDFANLFKLPDAPLISIISNGLWYNIVILICLLYVYIATCKHYIVCILCYPKGAINQLLPWHWHPWDNIMCTLVQHYWC